MRRIRAILIAAVVAVAAAATLATPVLAQWPTICVDLNDIVENHLGRDNNVGIYQRAFGDQAEAGCQGDHREDVRGVFGWAFDLAPPAQLPAVAASTLPLVNDALYSAVWRGRTEQVRTLVAGGLNANTRTSDNDPLIHQAVWRDHVEIVRILADAGANVNATDSDGDPVIHSAIWRDHASVVQVLVDAGANVDASDSSGDPVLREAIWRGHTNVVRILVNAGADVNAEDSDGDPLLFEGVWRGHTQIVRILVNAGVDVSAPDARGRSALSRAQFYDHPEIVQILLAAPSVAPQLGWPTTCIDLNDIVENHLGNDNNVGIYQRAFGDQAEAGCRGDHREDVRGVFAWAFDIVTPTRAQSGSDRAVLVALYHSTGGANWDANANWLSDRPIGEWRGVTTNSNGRVIQLTLPGNNLTGALPAELGGLSNLTDLVLYNNGLTGEIPPELGGLSNLITLSLDSNRLTGEIPPELGGLSNLTGLFLHGNQLTGEIPPELGGLSNLRGLSLDSNQLTGEIPPELGRLSNLTHLFLSNNQLRGCIPKGLRDIANNDLAELNLPDCGASTPGATATATPTATPTPASEGAAGVCHVGLIVSPGESCTYPGTSAEFSVDSSGTGRFLFFTAGTGISARNTTINGVTYNFKASKQGDGTWIIEAAGDS